MNNPPPFARKIALGTSATQSYIQAITSGDTNLKQALITRTIVSTAFFLFVAKLNTHVVRNLLARPQLMDASFDKLRLCGTFKAPVEWSQSKTGRINHPVSQQYQRTLERISIQGQPGDVHRRPRWISPYHQSSSSLSIPHRLDHKPTRVKDFLRLSLGQDCVMISRDKVSLASR